MKHRAALALTALFTLLVPAASAQPSLPPPLRNVVSRAPGAWRPRCVASVGCPAPRAVPSCAAGVMDAEQTPPVDVATAWDRRFDLAGQRVSVLGRLRAASGCTEMACPEGSCCNRCSGRLDLAGPPSRAQRSLALGLDADAAFACAGDDSGVCCGTAAPDRDVLVRGVLRAIPASGGRWRIESPTLCAP